MIDFIKILDLISVIQNAFVSIGNEIEKVKAEKRRKELFEALEKHDLDKLRILLFDPNL